MLEYALLSVTPKTPGHPTMEEVFDFLFSEARGDPEARDLERRLQRLVRELLHQPLPKKKRLL
jgi:hypothetical protein